MTYLAFSLKPGVRRAWPVGQPPIWTQAAASPGPAARWMAPHTPPPGRQPIVGRIHDRLDIELGDVALGDAHAAPDVAHFAFARSIASVIILVASSASAQRP